MGLVFKLLIYHTLFVQLTCERTVYDNLNANSSLGLNCSETLDKFGVTNLDYSVEDFTDYSQDHEEEKYKPDIPKSRQSRSIKRVLSWVGRGFNKVFNSPYIYNFYPIINYSVGKIMQHLPFMSNNAPSNTGPPSPDYQQSSAPQQPNPQQLQQQQMQKEYEEEMEKKQHDMQRKQEEAEQRTKHLAEEKKLINERAKKLAAKYVEQYFAKQAQTSQTTSLATILGMLPQNYVPGAAAAYNVPAQPAVYNNQPAVYDQGYVQPNYEPAYPAVDNLAEPIVYNPNPVNYVNTQ